MTALEQTFSAIFDLLSLSCALKCILYKISTPQLMNSGPFITHGFCSHSFKMFNLNFFSFLEQKEEKDSVKPDESGKLQNGENAKDGGTAAPVVNVSEEKKKATKQRFMFNIADGGFTGGHTCSRSHFFLFSFLLFRFCLF